MWKLALVLAGQAPEHLLDTYDAERAYAADENILNSTRSTDFITPKTAVDRVFRDATLELDNDELRSAAQLRFSAEPEALREPGEEG